MARTVSLAKIRGLARLYADQRPKDVTNAFVVDVGSQVGDTYTAGLTDIVNLAVGEFNDRLNSAGANGSVYWRTSQAVTIVAGTSLYTLPDDFADALGLELHWAATDVEEVPMLGNHRDRYKYLNLNNWGSWTAKAWHLVGEQFEILPTPTSVPASGTKLWYIPTFTEMADKTSPLFLETDDMTIQANGWERAIALRSAIDLKVIEESDPSDLWKLYEADWNRIEGAIAGRKPAAGQVADVMPELGQGLEWPYTGGRVTTS